MGILLSSTLLILQKWTVNGLVVEPSWTYSLPSVPSVDLQLLGAHPPYVPNVDPDGRPRIEAPSLWDQRSNVIRFVRTDAN